MTARKAAMFGLIGTKWLEECPYCNASLAETIPHVFVCRAWDHLRRIHLGEVLLNQVNEILHDGSIGGNRLIESDDVSGDRLRQTDEAADDVTGLLLGGECHGRRVLGWSPAKGETLSPEWLNCCCIKVAKYLWNVHLERTRLGTMMDLLPPRTNAHSWVW